MESAEEALQAAKQNRSKRKAALLRMAHQEVTSARDNLKRASGTEEMRRLRDGYDLHIAEEVMEIAQGKLRGAEYHVKRWKIFLRWIDDQHPAIAAECGLSPNNTLDVALHAIGGKEDPFRQEEQPQLLERERQQGPSVLSPDASSKVSKSLKARARSSRVRVTIATRLDESHAPVVASAQQGDSDDDRRSQVRPCPSTSTLEPRRSARIAERMKGLQESKAPSRPSRLMGREAHELSRVKRQKEQETKGAKTRSSERVKARYTSRPQGVAKRRCLSR